MATAAETEAPSTDASWKSRGGGGGDDGMKPALPELESSLQNGGGDGGGGAGPEETAAAEAARSYGHEQPQQTSEAAAAALPKGAEEPERPFRRSFQIPRKSREKKALFQPLTPGSREFEDVLNILHSSYLEPSSVTYFNYRRACLIHNELLEKEFTEKRRELKFDGRLDKELSESYAFLMVDRYQYYFYEYGFDEVRRRPRHVCPYAVVSFTYKDDVQTPKFLSPLRSNSFNADRNIDKFNYTLWKGQLLNKGKLLCYISLRSANRAFLPVKLPEKLDVETVMSIDCLKQKIPPSFFYKDTYVGPNEVLKNGMYCSLYEVVEKTNKQKKQVLLTVEPSLLLLLCKSITLP